MVESLGANLCENCVLGYKSARFSVLNIWNFYKNFEKKCNKWRGWVHIVVGTGIGIESWLPVVRRVPVLTFYCRRDMPSLKNGQRTLAYDIVPATGSV
jgi:hypothetical protein